MQRHPRHNPNMQKIGFNEALDAIVERYPDYDRDAYHFLREALEFTVKNQQKKRGDSSRHVDAAQLLEGWRAHALKEYGPMVPTIMESWGITSCRDIGVMVFRLIEAGIFGKTPADKIEDFEKGFDFHEAFVAPFLPESRKGAPAAPGQHVPAVKP